MKDTHRITILDGLETNPRDLSWEPIYKHGILTVYDDLIYDEDEIIERIADSDMVITVDTPLTKRVISSCKNIKYIGAMATGYNHIDLDACEKRGITVTNVPSYSTLSVARRTIALLMELSERVSSLSQIVKNGGWTSPFPHWETPSFSLDNKTLGIIGYGRIGRKTAKIAKAMGMNVIAYKRNTKEEKDDIASFVSLDTLFSTSDVIALHAPLNDDSYHIINSETIEKIKNGVIILNTSRGALIDEDALIEGLISKKIWGVGLDVMENEPRKESPLFSLDNVIITPHSAWTDVEARRTLIYETGENIKAYLENRERNTIRKEGQ